MAGSALTCGTDVNLAYVFTSPKRADLVPGPRPAPELARYDRIHTERDGVRAPGPRPAPPGEALALLHAIWTAETTPARQQRYRDLLAAGPQASARSAV
jgi:hypothetical protein